NLQPNTSYSFDLCTFDVAGNYSGWTEDVTARTLSGTAVEGAPVANSDYYYTTEGTDLTVSAADGVLANDSDPNGLELTAIQVVTGDPLTDNVTLSSNGSFTYHAFPGFIGTDTFIYRAYNGTYYSEPTTVTITVGSASGNQPPVINTIGTKTATLGSLLQFQIVATDPDDDPLSFMLMSYPAGADIISNSGVFSWTPTLTFPYDTYPVRVQVSDGRGGVTEQTFTILIGDTPRDLTTVPLEGAGRIDTAIEVSKCGFDHSDYVIIATAYAFPDALGGSSLAGVLNAPILLTSPTALPDAVRNEIIRLGASQVIVLGGESAVNADVYNQLDAIAGASVDRIWGANRYATAQAIASETISLLGGAYDGTAFIATGANFPDALGASPIAAAKGWPIYLANPNQGDNAALINTMRSHGVTDALILGGPTVVSWEVQAALGSLFEDRLFGDNRYLTSVAVAQYGTGPAGLSWNRVAIATGANFPDALSGGALQGAGDSVMLLTPPSGLHSEVATVLRNNKDSITEVRFLGGPAALPQFVREAVVSALE
ncbi:MAG: cadherin-like domain-containing protein, partial [Coriobacteriaceae bacterium]|nr:cadherin-like domain-containing protein [Coriobacteriaceae bacterium]